MLKRLYKKEVEQVVMRHEEYRQALQREYERKQKIEEDKRLSDQALADLDELDKELAKYWENQTFFSLSVTGVRRGKTPVTKW